MEFTVTKEQILEFANWGNPDNKKKLKEWFPKAFESQLEVGKWYKGNVGFESLIFITKIEDMVIFNKIHYYGFYDDDYEEKNYIANRYHEASLVPASNEEVESALIAEAKKRGYKVGVRIKGLGNGEVYTLPNGKFEYLKNANVLWYEGFDVFKDGKWAEILPEQKTIITKGKALRIIAKKLKVSPESIEIQ